MIFMKKLIIPFILCVFIIGFVVTYKVKSKKGEQVMEKPKVDLSSIKNKGEIYLAGGCFWGVEGYFSKIEMAQRQVTKKLKVQIMRKLCI